MISDVAAVSGSSSWKDVTEGGAHNGDDGSVGFSTGLTGTGPRVG